MTDLSTKCTPPIAWHAATAQAMAEAARGREGALLPLLHELQAAFGYIHADTIDIVAEALNLSRAEVHGVVTFYHDFRREPPPKLVVKVCRAEACQAVGGREAAQALLDKLGLDWGEPSPDGGLVVEPVYCLGLCAVGPSALIGDELVAGFDGRALSAAVNGAR
jgi:formate dehydrogenase subunit gamma